VACEAGRHDGLDGLSAFPDALACGVGGEWKAYVRPGGLLLRAVPVPGALVFGAGGGWNVYARLGL
jgi:hypothetical protein